MPPNRFLRLLEASSSRRAYAQPGEPDSRDFQEFFLFVDGPENGGGWWLAQHTSSFFHLGLYFIFAVQRDLSEGVFFFCFFKGGILKTQLSTPGSRKKKYVVIAKKPCNLIVSMALMNFSLEKLSVMAMFGILTAWHATGNTANQGSVFLSPTEANQSGRTFSRGE